MADALPPHVPTDKPPSEEELLRSLHSLIKKGLPVTPDSGIPAVLALRGVWARAVDPADPMARLQAADKLIRKLLLKITIAGVDRPELPRAALLLFGGGIARGRSQTWRRRAAAELLNYSAEHVRGRIEPKVLKALAWALIEDSLNYVPRGRKVPAAEASGDTPTITAEDLSDPKEAAHQILLSRVWSDVYALRADLITREISRGTDQARFEEAAEQAELTLGSLLLHLDSYMESYGENILHGDAEFRADALIRLAGWTGELSEKRVRELKWKARRPTC